MFNKPFSFDGRIRRTEYGLSVIIYFFAYSIISFIGFLSLGIGLLLFIPLFIFFLAQGTKRCHDMGNSGWWQLIPFYAIIMIFQDGQPGTNQYGENPKGDNSTSYANTSNAKINPPLIIPEKCPHCKNPNTTLSKVCEWCGGQIC